LPLFCENCFKSLKFGVERCTFCDLVLHNNRYCETYQIGHSDSDFFCEICLNCSFPLRVCADCNSPICTKCHFHFVFHEDNCPYCEPYRCPFELQRVSLLPVSFNPPKTSIDIAFD
jgi:hypothetical protein